MTDAVTADDLVQETCLRAWKYFDSQRSGANCRAWMFQILRNVWADTWRRTRLELPLPIEEEQGLEPYYEWEPELLRNEISEGTQAALRALPAEYRWAVLLADVEELTYREIADVLRCPIGTVMSRISRGRRMLSRLLRVGKTNPSPAHATTRSPNGESR